MVHANWYLIIYIRAVTGKINTKALNFHGQFMDSPAQQQGLFFAIELNEGSAGAIGNPGSFVACCVHAQRDLLKDL